MMSPQKADAHASSCYTIALIGRPNVGKSTLFNCLTKTQDALVANYPGLTHDRQYGQAQFEGQRFIVIDMAGLDSIEPLERLNQKQLKDEVQRQAQLAILEADIIVFVVDAKSGLSPMDQKLAQKLRHYQTPIFLALNKIDGINPQEAQADFSQLGFPLLYPISAAHRRGIQLLMQAIIEHLPSTDSSEFEKLDGSATPLAVVGRPNSGKSTLINRLLNEERLVVSETSGTTRSCIATPFSYQKENYLLLDTAGIRRRKYANSPIEKLSVIKSLKAIQSAHIVIAIIDAEQGLVEQDIRLFSFVANTGCGLILAVNKWDLLTQKKQSALKKTLQDQLTFLDFCPICFISAKQGTGIEPLLQAVQKVHHAIHQTCPTSAITKILEQAIEKYPPPQIGHRRIKLRYAHVGRYRPLTIIIHGKQVNQLPITYRRYLNKQFMKHLSFTGVPIRLVFKQNENPYDSSKK